MVDRNDVIELAPHYVAMLVFMFLALAIVRSILGEVRFLVELVVVIVVVGLYRPLVLYLGIAPSAWER